MKYLCAGLAVSLALVGCNAKESAQKEGIEPAVVSSVVEQSVSETTTTAGEQQALSIIHFSGADHLKLELKSSDNFETAELIDNTGKTYQLKAVVAASGIKMANDEGVSIHFKKGEGIVEFKKDQPINIQEVQ